MLDKIREKKAIILFFVISFLFGHACMTCRNCIAAYSAYRYVNIYGDNTMVFEVGD